MMPTERSASPKLLWKAGSRSYLLLAPVSRSVLSYSRHLRSALMVFLRDLAHRIPIGLISARRRRHPLLAGVGDDGPYCSVVQQLHPPNPNRSLPRQLQLQNDPLIGLLGHTRSAPTVHNLVSRPLCHMNFLHTPHSSQRPYTHYRLKTLLHIHRLLDLHDFCHEFSLMHSVKRDALKTVTHFPDICPTPRPPRRPLCL